MGITIHYKGKLDKADNIGKMLFELADISKDLGWKYKMVDDAKQEVQGVIIQPHEKCEPFTVLLNKNLRLISFAALCLHETNDDKALSASIKTQYAPLHIHISVIKLLKYLKDKYI
ncbi:MAG: hypothetical protein KAR20_29795, partial [Candidatus Heimdallarchaeota archaeon]|nr:hypothetical protein [Candidatus Heimdallarchaeota archaeon]